MKEEKKIERRNKYHFEDHEKFRTQRFNERVHVQAFYVPENNVKAKYNPFKNQLI